MRDRIRNLVQELRNRSVFRALVAYGVVAWMLLQVADVTFDRLPIPENSMTVLIVLVAIGFPAVVVLAWAYELTTRGIVRHEESGTRAPRLAFLPFVAVVVVVALASGFLLYYLSQNFWESPRRSIAVLPFVNTSGEAETEYFSEGLTEEIQSLIVRLNEFRVVAMSTSRQFKDSVMDVVTIANRLNAESVLMGSVRRYQNKVTVTARLIDGSDGRELWSEKYDRELSDIYAIQEDIARHVARSLHVVLPVSADRRLKNLGTSNVEAYDAYLRGIDFLRKPPDETSLLMAEGLLREALAIDPDYANAHAAMCRKHLSAYRLSADAQRFGRAEKACQRALEHGEDSVDVRLVLGWLYLASGKNEDALRAFEEARDTNTHLAEAYVGMARAQQALDQVGEAEANLRLAIATDASYWRAFNEMGHFMFFQGRYEEAAEFYQMFVDRVDDDAQALNNLGAAHYLSGDFKKAAEAWDQSIEIKPTRSAYSNTGTMYFYLGDFDRAIERYVNAANLAPNDYRMWGNLGDAYHFQGDQAQVAEVAYKRAIELGQSLLKVNDADVQVISDVALYYSRIGDTSMAHELNARATSQGPGIMYVHYNSALIHVQSGELDKALAALERAVELNYERELLQKDPALESLRDNERFRQLVSNNRS
jgi:TolB-like protein/tetratricopeptide (TPR) repeat protein